MSPRLLQTEYWTQVKTRHGWRGTRLPLGYRGLIRPIRPFGDLVYVPHGPEPGDLLSVVEEVRQTPPPGAFLVRFDLPGDRSQPPAGLRKASVDIQPPDTVVVDLSLDEQNLLSAMHKKTRYNVKLAARKGVEIHPAGIEALDEWYELYRITSERDRIAIHSKDYYRSVFELAEAPVHLQFLLAYHEGQLLAGIVVGIAGDCATYLYGASSNEKRNLMPAYLLQWEAMRFAKAAGCLEYDLFGIPPSDDPDHPMHGLYRFKTGFGGRIEHRLGCWDLPLAPNRYAVYRAAERSRDWYYKKFKKR